MQLCSIYNYLESRWGFNKTISIIGLNLCAMGIVTVIGIYVIPDKPIETESKGE